MPPSKLIVNICFPAKGGFLIGGGFLMRGVDRTKHRFLFCMRGVIVPPSKLIVTMFVPHKVFVLIRGVFLLRGGYYY